MLQWKWNWRFDLFGVALFAAALLLCLALATLSLAQTRADQSACSDLVGTYLIEVFDGDPLNPGPNTATPFFFDGRRVSAGN